MHGSSEQIAKLFREYIMLKKMENIADHVLNVCENALSADKRESRRRGLVNCIDYREKTLSNLHEYMPYSYFKLE